MTVVLSLLEREMRERPPSDDDVMGGGSAEEEGKMGRERRGRREG